MKKIYTGVDFMSACTVELMGSFFLYLGYIFFNEIEKDKVKCAVYYGALGAVLNFATFELTGGAFNISLMLGGLILESVVDKRQIGIFFGGLIGCMLARLLNYELFSDK